jgi:hypothetical protein
MARKAAPKTVFIDLSDNVKSELREELKSQGYTNIRYSGREKGFYATK